MGCGRPPARVVTAVSATDGLPPGIDELRTMLAPRAVVLDIDGTLIDDELVLQPRVRDAVRSAVGRLPVVLATGRMFVSALPWARELGVEEPLVCYQGALVRHLPRGDDPGAVLHEEGLTAPLARDCIDIAREHGWHRQAYVDDELLCEEDRREAHVYARIAQVAIRFVDDLTAAVAAGSTKIVCVSEDIDVVDVCVATMRERLRERVRVTRSMTQFVEMVSPRVNKAIAVETVLATQGIALSEAVAVGDAPNDAEMLAAAGVGVVVRGARREVLVSADAVCAGPTDGGVADVLERFGLV